MTEETPNERGWRGSPELWLDAAYEALVAKGVDAVKIMPLASALKLSRTSFYWFFKDRRQLLSLLLERWEDTTTAPLLAAASQPAATETEAMLAVISTFLPRGGFDARIELAVRAWAQQDAAVLARLQAADAERLSALSRLLGSWGHDPQDADTRARAIYLVQVGYISMRIEESTAERLARFPAYVEIYTGKRPSGAEMQRLSERLRLPEG